METPAALLLSRTSGTILKTGRTVFWLHLQSYNSEIFSTPLPRAMFLGDPPSLNEKEEEALRVMTNGKMIESDGTPTEIDPEAWIGRRAFKVPAPLQRHHRCCSDTQRGVAGVEGRRY